MGFGMFLYTFKGPEVRADIVHVSNRKTGTGSRARSWTGKWVPHHQIRQGTVGSGEALLSVSRVLECIPDSLQEQIVQLSGILWAS